MHEPARHHPADLALRATLGACRLLAWPLGVILELGLRRHGAALLPWLSKRPGGARLALRHIAFTRLARASLKLFLVTGGQATVLRRVHCRGMERLPSGGCVLAVAHSPWGRVLARWAVARNFAFIFAHRRWAQSAGALHLCPTPAGVRRAVAELARGRRVVVVIDDFVARGGCAVELLGIPARALMRAARLAARGGVPVVPVRLSQRHDDIRVDIGTPLDPGRRWTAYARTTRALLAQLARWTMRRPEEWNDLFHFFDRQNEPREHGRTGKFASTDLANTSPSTLKNQVKGTNLSSGTRSVRRPVWRR